MSKVTNPEREGSVSCGFFNSLNDRKYDAIQMSRLFDGIINDGIFASIGTCFVVRAESGNMVNIGIGKAWFNHTWTENDAILPIECEKSELLLDRIDAIVIEINANEEVRDNFIKVVKGVPSSTPVRPKMIDTDMVHQHACCYIYRRAGSTEIRQADITNVVGTDETPFVTGPLQLISLDELLGQWTDKLDRFIESEEFDFEKWYAGMKAIFQEKSKILDGWTENKQNDFIAWFNHIRDQLDSDQAGHLQNQLTALKEKHDKDIDSVTKKLITLTVTTDDAELVGDTVRVAKGTTVLEQMLDASKSITFHLPELGTWTILNTNSEHGGRSEVTCEMYGRYSATISGAFNLRKWVTAGGLSADGYASFTDVLADERAVRQLMTKHASADILADAMIKNRAGFRANITDSKTAMKWIGLRDYICDKLLADAETQAGLLASDHWRYILKDGVPYMTSATSPYGEVETTASVMTPYYAYKVFSDLPGSTTNSWATPVGERRIGYRFVNPICIKRVAIVNRVEGGAANRCIKDFVVVASNDGKTWDELGRFTGKNYEGTEAHTDYFDLKNDKYYLHYAVKTLSSHDSSYVGIGRLNFYGRSLNVSIPIMSSNTSPWGKAISSELRDVRYDSYKAFDRNPSDYDGGSTANMAAVYMRPDAYVGYVFPQNTAVRWISFSGRSSAAATQNVSRFIIQYSDDGMHWGDATQEMSNPNASTANIFTVEVPAVGAHRYWRCKINANRGDSVAVIAEMQFYGVDYSERDDRTYIYDHGMELTPLNVKIADGTIPLNPPEKKETYIQLTAPSGKSCGVGVAIDVTNLKRLRAVTDQGTINVGEEFGRFFATTEGNTQAYIAYASASAPPYNHSLDLTSITGVKTLVHLVWSGLSTGLSEMWLE